MSFLNLLWHQVILPLKKYFMLLSEKSKSYQEERKIMFGTSKSNGNCLSSGYWGPIKKDFFAVYISLTEGYAQFVFISLISCFPIELQSKFHQKKCILGLFITLFFGVQIPFNVLKSSVKARQSPETGNELIIWYQKQKQQPPTDLPKKPLTQPPGH